jgi:hypothetical protein
VIFYFPSPVSLCIGYLCIGYIREGTAIVVKQSSRLNFRLEDKNIDKSVYSIYGVISKSNYNYAISPPGTGEVA